MAVKKKAEKKINSKQKGKRGELEIAHFFQKHGYDARRSQQYAGINNDADVVGVPGIHLEIKRTEKLHLQAAMEQSISEARADEKPVVMHKKNHTKWLVTMPLIEWMDLYQAWEREQGKDGKNETDKNTEGTP